MKVVWGKYIEDVVNIARIQGWMFHLNREGKHFYYLYVGIEAEMICFVIETDEPLNAKYVSIDEEGKLTTSDRPIMPACAKITEVAKDEVFESVVK